MLRALSLSLIALGVVTSPQASAAPVQRTLEIGLSIDATQDWRNDPKWGKSSTQQRYTLSAQLRSDGQLYADNLLDPDPVRRMAIKNNWYLYKGLRQLKAENGGKLPTGAERPVLSAESIGSSGGMMSPALADVSPERMTALQALTERPAAELEAFMQPYERPGGRWMYFEGFAGCTNQLQLQYHSRFDGDIAKKSGNKAPFDMQWDADTLGTPEQQQSLCRRYVATYEVATDTLTVENLYLPSPRGISVRHEFGRTERKERELPPPYEVMRWADDALKQARSTGKLAATLPLTAALDGNDAALGSFVGTAKVTLEWSFR